MQVMLECASKFIRCKIPELDNDTYEIQGDFHRLLIDKYIPLKQDGKYETCLVNVFNSTRLNSNSSFYETNCDEYVYSKKFYEKTLVTDVSIIEYVTIRIILDIAIILEIIFVFV